MRILLILVVVLSGVQLAAIEYVNPGKPEFKFEVPAGFSAVPNDPGDFDTICGFQNGDLENPDRAAMGIFIEGYGHEIESFATPPKDFTVLNPAPLLVRDKYLAKWNGKDINAAWLSGSDPSGSYSANVHTAWVPTKGEALIVTVFGANTPESQVRAMMASVLASLIGPGSGADAMAIGIGLTVGAVILFAIIGFVVVMQKRRTPHSGGYGGGYSGQAGYSAGPAPMPPSGPTSSYKPKRQDAAPWE